MSVRSGDAVMLSSQMQIAIEEIVWEHTRVLAIDDGVRPALNRLQGTLAYRLSLLSAGSLARGRFRRTAVPACDDAAVSMRAVIAQALGEPAAGLGIYPKRLALWPLEANDKPREGLPTGADWIENASPHTVFTAAGSSNGQLGYFESETPAPAFESIVTPLTIPVRVLEPESGKWSLLGLFAAGLFVATICGAIASGALVGNAYELLNAPDRGVPGVFDSEVKRLCGKSRFVDDPHCAKESGKTARTIARSCLSQQTADVAHRDLVGSEICVEIWRTALRAADSLRPAAFNPSRPCIESSGVAKQLCTSVAWLAGKFTLSGQRIGQGASVSIVWHWLGAMASLFVLFVSLGFGSTGRWSGVAINAQNRLSLSQLQVSAWTILLVSAYAVIAGFNIGLVAEAPLPLDLEVQLSYFPAMPPALWVVLGVTSSTPFLSTLIKGWTPGEMAGRPEAGAGTDAGLMEGIKEKLRPLGQNASASQASLGDLFFGETANNGTRVDITRAQNVLFTLVLLLVYGTALVGLMGDISVTEMFSAIDRPAALIEHFPDPGGTFALLLFGTHAAFLLGKFQ